MKPNVYLGTIADFKSLEREVKGPWLKSMDWPRVCFVGRSNVGKSSLINAVLGQAAARVSQSPGKTAALHFYRWDAAPAVLVDLPGYGYAKRPKEERDDWRKLLDSYFRKDVGVARILLLLDARHGPSDHDLDAYGFFASKGFPVTWVFTKFDTLKNQAERARRLREAKEAAEAAGQPLGEILWVSVKDKDGVKRLGSEVSKRLAGEGFEDA